MILRVSLILVYLFLSIKISFADDIGITVVIASKGYPGEFQTGKEISGLESLNDDEEIQVFHSGTAFEEGKLVSNGGRVLSVTARAKDLESAREKVYDALTIIQWENGFYRNDIGFKYFKK